MRAKWWRRLNPDPVALRRGARAALVIPLALLIARSGVADPQALIFIVFGCFALLVMADGGPRLVRRSRGQRSAADATTKVTPMRNGPLLVTGKIEVQREDGTVETLPRATLCRCGESQHKPFCDNQHLAIGFRAPGVPFRIHLSPVRSQLDKPMTKAEDPRGR